MSNETSSRNVTTATLKTTFDSEDALHFVTIAFGLSAIVTNSILLNLSRINHMLKKDAKRLQAALAVADIILGIGAIIMAVDALRIKFINVWAIGVYCMFVGITKLFGDALSLTITLAMAVERFIAIAFPIKYRSMNKKKFSMVLILGSIAVCTTFSFIGFYGIDPFMVPSFCSGGAVRIKALKPMLSYFNCAVGSMVIVMYVLMTIEARQKFKIDPSQLQSGDKASYERMIKKEIEVTKVVTLIGLSCIAFYIVPNIVSVVFVSLGLNVNFDLFVSNFALCNASVNFFLYMWKDEKLRKAFIRWKRHEDPVEPVTVSVSNVFTKRP